MSIIRRYALLGLICLLSIESAVLGHPAQAKTVSIQQLQALAPDESDLQGFMRVRPAGELPEGWAPKIWSPQTQTLTVPVSPAIPLEDEIDLNPGGTISTLRRTLYSEDGLYRVDVRLQLCSTPEDAAKSLASYLHSCQGVFKRGTFDDDTAVGDESWALHTGGTANVLICRFGRVVVLAAGDTSASAARHQMQSEFPKAAVEAVIYQSLLRASRQPALTGVPFQTARLAVNGRSLPEGGLKVAGRAYIPVQEFARAMGLTSGWDAKTGALTLTGAGRKAVALTAGSTAATVGGAKAAALSVPVLKDGGEPVMALSDLLTLTGGRVTGHAGNTVQVKG